MFAEFARDRAQEFVPIFRVQRPGCGHDRVAVWNS